jgi:hypothetical protein
MVFGKATRTVCLVGHPVDFNFCFVLMVASVENLDSQRYIVANGIEDL